MTVFRVFVPFALGYFLSYLLRVVNAVIAPDLVRELGLTAAELGFLTSANFFAFAAFQLPLGILLDRFGPRRTNAALLLFAALGAFIFSAATSAPGLIAGRALIGLGTSACLMAAFKAYVMWFPGERIPLLNGCQMAAGGLGAVTGTVPVEAVLAFTDWRGIFVIFGVMALAFAVAIYLVVPRRKVVECAAHGMKDQLAGIAEVYTNPLFWRIAPMTVASQSMFLGVQGLWSGPWLADVAGLDRDAVAHHLLMIAVAMVVGFLGIGTIAQRLDRLGVRTIQVAVAGMSLFACVQLILVAQWTGAVLPTWVLFGFFGTSGILSYAALLQSFAPELAGRVITGLNVLTFAGAFAVQWVIGAIINLWPAAGDGDYSPEGYQAAFALMLVLQIASLVWYAVFREQSQHFTL